MKSRRRPKRSPSAAPNISRTAKVSVYALTVHSRSSSAAAEVLADGGQGGGDDEVVECRHEAGDAGDDEGPDGWPRGAWLSDVWCVHDSPCELVSY